MGKHIDKQTEALWQNCAQLLKDASTKVELVRSILVLNLDSPEKATKRINAISEALSGQAYMFTPQHQWTGGNSLDVKNYKAMLPHIARQ